MGKLRELRRSVLEALACEPWPGCLERLDHHPPKSLVGPLFACLLEPDALLAGRAATALGRTTARLFALRPEDARQLVRQFMWRLNEESGNVGWGIPESFGETLAHQPVLAREFHKVLASYLVESDRKTGDTFIDLPPLRRGVYAGLGRLAQARPELALCAIPWLLAGLAEKDPASRGQAAWTLGLVLPLAGDDAPRIRQALATLAHDGAGFPFYRDGALHEVTVACLAGEAVK